MKNLNKGWGTESTASAGRVKGEKNSWEGVRGSHGRTAGLILPWGGKETDGSYNTKGKGRGDQTSPTQYFWEKWGMLVDRIEPLPMAGKKRRPTRERVKEK